MRVAIDDDVGVIPFEQLFGPRCAELVSVTDMDPQVANLHVDGCCQSRIAWRIRVAKHGAYGRDERELVENFVTPDVASVQVQFDPGERRMHARPHQPVCVRDQADDVRAAIAHCSTSSPQRGASCCGTPRWSSTRATTKFTRSSTLRG